MASQLLIVIVSQLRWFLGAYVNRTNPDTNLGSIRFSLTWIHRVKRYQGGKSNLLAD